jgi:carboxymethylenebutenolidase
MSHFTLDLPDGSMEVRYFAPESEPRGGVLFLMDAFGLRPELDAMTSRYADAGWLTLLPDLYRRLDRRVFPVPAGLGTSPDQAMLAANEGTALAMTSADLGALIDFAASRLGVHRFGAVGYCMGVRHALAAAVAWPNRILAVAGLHGGRMVNDREDSPHLLIGQSRAAIYLGMARDDPDCPDAHQRVLETEAARAGPRVTVERIDALHGWTFPERYCHDERQAEPSFAKVLDLFEREVAPPSMQD